MKKIIDPITDEQIAEVANTIVRVVEVDFSLDNPSALNATDRRQYVRKKVVDAAPSTSTGKQKVEVTLFRLNRYASDPVLEQEFASRDLNPACLKVIAALNADDPSFADEHPNGTHWQDEECNWCCAYFDRLDGKRCVGVYRDDFDWDDYCWFAGVRKSPLAAQ